MKIHFVEDNPDFLEAFRLLMEIHGLAVRPYLRGLDLIDARASIGPADLLVTDFYLPDINGIQLVRRVREFRPSLPAILLTGSRDDHIRAAARDLPRCRILYKPVEIDALLEELRRLTGEREPVPRGARASTAAGERRSRYR